MVAPLELQATLRPGGLQDGLQRLVGEAVALEVVRAEDLASPGRPPSPFIRHRQYRDGRRALGRVLARLGMSEHPLTISMPHPRLSLSHTGDVAVAVGLLCDQQAGGVGVDIEGRRPIDMRSARFFLDDDELHNRPDQMALIGVQTGAEQLALQRLWTIKEAVFKADLNNARRQLRDYHIDYYQPLSRPALGDAWVGRAHCGSAVFGFRSFVLDEHLLTIATCERTTS